MVIRNFSAILTNLFSMRNNTKHFITFTKTYFYNRNNEIKNYRIYIDQVA